MNHLPTLAQADLNQLCLNLGSMADYEMSPVAGVKRERPAELEAITPPSAEFNFAAPPATLPLPPVSTNLISKINTQLNKPDSVLNLPIIKPAPPIIPPPNAPPQASTSAVTLDLPPSEPAQDAPRKKAKKSTDGGKGGEGGAGKSGKGGKEGAAKPTRQRNRASRANNQGSTQAESLWPPELDEQLMRGLEQIPNTGRNTILLNGTTAGRNEILSEWLRRKTGVHRTRLQISSRLQKLRTANKQNRDKLKVLTQPALSDVEFAALDFEEILGVDEAAIKKGEKPAKLEISKAPPPTSNLKRGQGGKKQSPKAKDSSPSTSAATTSPTTDNLLDPTLQLSSISSSDSMYMPTGSTPASLADLFPNPPALDPTIQPMLPLAGFPQPQLDQQLIPPMQSYLPSSAPFTAFPPDLTLAPTFPMPVQPDLTLPPAPSNLSLGASDLQPFAPTPPQTSLPTTVGAVPPVQPLAPNPYQLPSFAAQPALGQMPPAQPAPLGDGLLSQAQLEQLTQPGPAQSMQSFGLPDFSATQMNSLLGLPPLTGV